MNNLKNIFNKSEDDIIVLLDELANKIDRGMIPDLIELLGKTPNQIIKHKVALLLHDLKDDRAIEPLIDEISKLSNKNYRGTLVYACEAFDCSDYLELFIDLIINDSNEVATTSVMVIENMREKFDSEILSKQILKLEKALSNDSDNYESIEEAKDFLQELNVD